MGLRSRPTFVGFDGTILTTTDAGTNWKPQTSGTNANLHQFTQTVPPPARLVWRGQPMTAVNPQSVGNHPTA